MKSRAAVGWMVSAAATALWLIFVVSTGNVSRVVTHWEASLTMLFGSFLSGSSPAGGGAVAFPVFTKVLGTPSAIARTFGLSIQTFGMGMATFVILFNRRPVHWVAVRAALGPALGGLAFGLWVLGNPDELHWPASIGSEWVKALFSIILFTTAFLMMRRLRGLDDIRRLIWTPRCTAGVMLVALGGGILSAWTGSGANILVFLFLVVLCGVDPKESLATCIIIMTAVSLAGLVILGLADGQFDTEVVDGIVTSVSDVAVDLPQQSSDLVGLLLAAIPVVVWGAPLGAAVAAAVGVRRLEAFVAVLATIEVVTTFVLVKEIRSDAVVLVSLGIGLVVLPALAVVACSHRQRLLGAQVVATAR